MSTTAKPPTSNAHPKLWLIVEAGVVWKDQTGNRAGSLDAAAEKESGVARPWCDLWSEDNVYANDEPIATVVGAGENSRDDLMIGLAGTAEAIGPLLACCPLDGIDIC